MWTKIKAAFDTGDGWEMNIVKIFLVVGPIIFMGWGFHFIHSLAA